MEKILLTSAGFLNKKVAEKFIELCGKPSREIRVIFVPTASRSDEELKYVKESYKELLDLGIKDIKTLELDHTIKTDEVAGYDVIYVCGGNSFYLLNKIRESEFDRILNGFDGVYVGVSAGSIVAGPDIETAAPWDENDVDLRNTKGLGFVDFAVAPHYEESDKDVIDEWKKKVSYEIKEITDNQAVLVEGDEVELVGSIK
ncbi:MAG TPA: Type 1 glutamine amidotransferase-like domain-containing protein [Candidatus Bipolaricaulota bacterium]|nr:Type 1 glutamine amidotransferase-like domain-containing protein [Candidatus Bipolaricaulota bacterium]